MIRKIRWEQKALDDFDDILAFLSERSQAGANSVERKLGVALDRLAHYSIGRSSRVSTLFEKPVPGTPYTVVYGLTDDVLVVVRIIHQSRDWPQGGWPAD